MWPEELEEYKEIWYLSDFFAEVRIKNEPTYRLS